MLYAAIILVVFLSIGNVECFQRVSQTHSTRIVNGFSSVEKFSFQISSQSVPLKELQRLTPRTVGLEVKRFVGLFMAFSVKKKMMAVARPLALVLLYLLFSSAFPSIQPNRLLSSVGSFLKSFRKIDQSIPTLTPSLAMVKVEDAAPEIKITVEKTGIKEIAKSTRIMSEAAIAQAKKDVEAQLLLIIDAENRVKLLRAQSVEMSNSLIESSAVVSSISDVVESPIISVIEPEAIIISSQELYPKIEIGLVDEMPDLPTMGITKMDEMPLLSNETKALDETSYSSLVETVPSSSVTDIVEPSENGDKNGDFVLASLLVFAVGSPLMQLFHQLTSTM